MTSSNVITRFFLITLFCFSAIWQSAVYAADGVAVNVNTATAVEIAEGLKGIGAKRAEAIVQYRDKNGQFKTLEALLGVKGVGEKTLELNKDVITL